MNNNTKKHVQRKNKNRRVSLFLGFGLAALVAGSTSTLLATIGKTHSGESINMNLNFALSEQDKSEGATLTGTTKFKFKNEIYLSEIETPVAEKTVTEPSKVTNYPFVDWIDNSGMTVKYNDAITQSTKLTATFSDYWERKGVTLFNVTFKTDDPEIYMKGITKLAVPSGRTFGSINKPQVFSTNPAKDKFKGWALESEPTYAVNQDLMITQNLVFVPVFSTSVLVNFNQREGETLVSGSLKVATEAGVKFGEVNQPTLSNGAYIFSGWSKDSEGKEPWSSDWVIEAKSEGYQAWAIWVESTATDIAKIHFEVNTDQGTKQPVVSYTGNTYVAVKDGTPWSKINRPTPTASGWKLAGWEYTQTAPGETRTWTELTGTETFAKDNTYYVRPIMSPNADAVKILGKDIAVQGLATQYTAFVAPAEASQEVTWSLWQDQSCATKLPDNIAEIDSTGLLHVYNGDNKPIYIRAVSKINNKAYDVKKVTLIPPYFQSYDYFTFHEDVSNPKNSKWWKLTGLDGSGPIEAWDGDTYQYTWQRSEFNVPVFVGDRIKTLPGSFLANCTDFNSPIVWTSKLQNIGPYFLFNCQNFNQKLDLSNIQNIDKEFCFSCYAFNNGSTEKVDNKLNLSSCYTIGDGFLDGCKAFNSTIDFGGDNAKIQHIGKAFLYQNESFNKDITFPATLADVGDFCMYNCYHFTSILTTKITADKFAHSDLNFSANLKEAPIYDQGFFVDGSDELKEQFEAKFGTIAYPSTTETGSAYRKVAQIAEFTTCTWKVLGQICADYENNVITLDKFLKRFTINGAKPSYLTDFVGYERKLKVNGIDHLVRVVDIQHDELADSTTKAVFTFEFKSLISTNEVDGENRRGGPIGCFWNANYSVQSADYLNSSLRACLTGEGTGEIGWYQPYATKRLYNIPLTSMVDTEFKAQLRNIKRSVPIYNSTQKKWFDTNYTTTFYLPFNSEIGVTNKGIGGSADKVYKWYRDIGITPSYQWSHKPANPAAVYNRNKMGYRITDSIYGEKGNYVSNWTNYYPTIGSTAQAQLDGLNWQWTGSPAATYTDTSLCPYSIRAFASSDTRFYQGSTAHTTALPLSPAFAI